MRRLQVPLAFIAGAILLALGWLALGFPAAAARDENSKVLTLAENKFSPSANIEDLAWLAGTWKGHGLGGKGELIYSEPEAGAIMGIFRLTIDGAVVFYEIATITERNESLTLRLKHFSPDLIGWEERDDWVEFLLVKIEPDAVYFDGITYVREEGDKLGAYVRIGQQDGSAPKVEFFSFVRS